MEVRRTAPVKLLVPDEYRDDLHETARQFLHCANRAADFCWDDTSIKNCVTANTTARDALYDELRGETDLTRQPCSRIHPTCRPSHKRVRRTVGERQAREPTRVHLVEYALR